MPCRKRFSTWLPICWSYKRSATPGPASRFPDDSHWQVEFDASFPYRETDDQFSAIDAIKNDMCKGRPMDRLLCGDVGYGKTEVAMRAAFKAVDGRLPGCDPGSDDRPGRAASPDLKAADGRVSV